MTGLSALPRRYLKAGLDTLRLLRDVWAVRRGQARRIARPGKWKVWREARGAVCVELVR